MIDDPLFATPTLLHSRIDPCEPHHPSGALLGLVASSVDGGVDSTRVREQVARCDAQRALRLAITLHRPLSAVGSTYTHRGRSHGRVLHIRARRGEERRPHGQRARLGRRVEEGCLRLGVQGATRQPRHSLPAVLQYRESLENPPLLVVSDLQTIQVHTNFTNSVKRVTTFTLDDLLDPEKLDRL